MFVKDFADEYTRYRSYGERAMAQIPEDALNRILTPESNSIATIVRHVGGNLASRFTDFLVSDGEKPFRNRDGEFDPGPFSRADVENAWKTGFDVLERELAKLSDGDLTKTISIRNVPLTVHEALCRSLSHVASHVGQIVFLSRLFAGEEWKTLTIPRGQSRQYNQNPTAEKAPSR